MKRRFTVRPKMVKASTTSKRRYTLDDDLYEELYEELCEAGCDGYSVEYALNSLGDTFTASDLVNNIKGALADNLDEDEIEEISDNIVECVNTALAAVYN